MGIRSTSTRFGVLFVLGVNSLFVNAAPLVDVLRINTQLYLRTTFAIDGFSYTLDNFVVADNGIGAVAFVAGPLDDQRGYLMHYDQYGKPLHDPVLIDPVHSMRPYYLRAAHHNGISALFWQSSVIPYFFVRVFDSNGIALCDSVQLTDHIYSSGGNWWVSVGDDRISTVIIGTYEDNGVKRLFLNSFAFDGSATSPTNVITPAYLYALDPRVFVSNSNHVFTIYNDGPNPPGLRTVLQGFDQNGDPWPSQIVDTNDDADSVWELQDGSIVVAYGSPGYVRRLSPGGLPLTPPVPLSTENSIRVEGTRDGRICQFLDPPGSGVFIQLFNSDWQPTTGLVRFQTPLLNAPEQSGTFVANELDYEEDGTIWLSWYAYNGPDENTYVCILKPFERGDMNRDGVVNNFDIDAFVLAITDLPAYSQQFDIPEPAAVIIGDVNSDGLLNNFDIDPFVALLAGE